MVRFVIFFVRYFALFIVVVLKHNPVHLSYQIVRNRFVMKNFRNLSIQWELSNYICRFSICLYPLYASAWFRNSASDLFFSCIFSNSCSFLKSCLVSYWVITMFFFLSLSFIRNSSLFWGSALIRAIYRLCLSALADVIVMISQYKWQTAECTQAFILLVSLSTALSMTFPWRYVYKLFHDAFQPAACGRFRTTQTYDRMLSNPGLDSSKRQVARRQPPAKPVYHNLWLSVTFFHDAMRVSHSMTLSTTLFVTLCESRSVSFFRVFDFQVAHQP